jgi:hypothetical protein
VCRDADCQEAKQGACLHLCPCGHYCSGTQFACDSNRPGEKHLGCTKCQGLNCVCGESCMTSPSIRLACGHTLHLKCAIAQYRVAEHPGRIQRPRCGFPGCLALPNHILVTQQFKYWTDLLAKVDVLIHGVIVAEDLAHEQVHVQNPASEYFHKPELFARDKLVCYLCHNCRKPFYGGHVTCEADEEDSKRVLCTNCSSKTCARHGLDSMVFKCFWCCHPATFECHGTPACEGCHGVYQAHKAMGVRPCDGTCAFPGHPPNGTSEEKFGYCALCVSESTE